VNKEWVNVEGKVISYHPFPCSNGERFDGFLGALFAPRLRQVPLASGDVEVKTSFQRAALRACG